MRVPTSTSEVLVAATLVDPGACPRRATPTLTPGKENCYCRKLDVFDGAAGQGYTRGVTPRSCQQRDPGQGDSQSRDLKFSEEAFVEC